LPKARSQETPRSDLAPVPTKSPITSISPR
jgi:hypothetical protein